MDEKATKLAEQLRKNPAMLHTLMNAPEGQRLLAMLTQGDQGAALKQAAQSAAQGNSAALAQLISQRMNSPEGAELTRRIQQMFRI